MRRSYFLNRLIKNLIQFHKSRCGRAHKDILSISVDPALCHHADEGTPQIGDLHPILHHIPQKDRLQEGGGQVDGGDHVLFGIIMAGQAKGNIEAGDDDAAVETAAGVQFPGQGFKGDAGLSFFKIAGNKMGFQMHQHPLIGNGVIGVTQLGKPLLHIFLGRNFVF